MGVSVISIMEGPLLQPTRSVRQPPLTGGMSATAAPGRISVLSDAYSESTAIITREASRGELGVLRGQGQAEVGDRCRQGQIEGDLGLAGALPGHGEEANLQDGTLAIAASVRDPPACSGRLPARDEGRRSRRSRSGCRGHQGVDAFVPGEARNLAGQVPGKDDRMAEPSAGTGDDDRSGLGPIAPGPGGRSRPSGQGCLRESGGSPRAGSGRAAEPARSASSTDSRISAGRLGGVITVAPAFSAASATGGPSGASGGGVTTTTGPAPPCRRAATTRLMRGWPSNAKSSLGRPIRRLLPAAGTMAGIRGRGHDALGGEVRGARPRGPRLRRAISSATMLMAISGTVCDPMSRPTGAVTRARSASADPGVTKVLEDQLDLAAAADQTDVGGGGRGQVEEALLDRGRDRG